MSKKPKSKPQKPKKAAAKKPAPKKAVAKKPAAKKPVKKAAPKKVKAKPAPKKVAKKPVVKALPKAKKPDPKKVVAVKAKPAPKAVQKPVVKAAPKVDPKAAKKSPEPKADAPKAAPKPKRAAPGPRKRFVVLPPRPLVPSEVKDEKNQKGLYKLEYLVTSSPDVLFEFLSTAGGLEKWFAPKVYIKDNIYVFSWGNDESKQAALLALREREFVRFRWVDQPEKRYFEFRLQIDDLTNEIALIVSDFADSNDEMESARLLWNAQIHDLLHALGSP